jgi:hypothetical protein
MDLRLTIKAVRSLQSFCPEISDELVIFGEILGVSVNINSPSAELLAKIDELLCGLNPPESPPQSDADEYADYQAAEDYTLGGVVDD